MHLPTLRDTRMPVIEQITRAIFLTPESKVPGLETDISKAPKAFAFIGEISAKWMGFPNPDQNSDDQK